MTLYMSVLISSNLGEWEESEMLLSSSFNAAPHLDFLSNILLGSCQGHHTHPPRATWLQHKDLETEVTAPSRNHTRQLTLTY